MVGLLVRRSKAEVGKLYYRDKEEHMRKEENCNRGFHFSMASSFFSSILISPCPMIMPKNSMRGASNTHLDSLSDSPCSLSCWSIRQLRS